MARRAWLVLALTAMAAAPERVLRVELRRRLWDHVRRYPGLHLREIARALDVQPNHAKYHLERLERSDLVSSRREDGYWRFWPREEGSVGYRDRLSRDEKTMLAVLRRPIPLHVVLLMLEADHVTHKDLLDAVDVSRSTLYYHMEKMQEAGIIESARDGQARRYWMRDPNTVRHLLQRYKPMPRLLERFVDAWSELVPAAQDDATGAPDAGQADAAAMPPAAPPDAGPEDAVGKADGSDATEAKDQADGTTPVPKGRLSVRVMLGWPRRR